MSKGFAVIVVIGLVGAITYWQWPDPAKEDAKQVHSILLSAGSCADGADRNYRRSMEVFFSIKMGKPIYQAHDEMKEPINILHGELDSLIDLRKDDVPKIINPEIRKNLDAGLALLIDVYATRYGMASDSMDVLENLTAANMEAIAAKFKDKNDGVTVEEAKAAGDFLDAKKLAGLPADLKEFQ